MKTICEAKMGQQIILNGAQFNDPKYPILRSDQRLTDGSLMLIDLSHSLSGISGVPTGGTIIPNIAVETAKKLVGGGDKNTLGCVFNNLFASGNGRFERTSKGALHGIVSASNRNQKVAGFELNSTTSPLLYNFIKNHLNDEYAVFLWTNVTRVTSATANINDSLSFANTASSSSNNMLGIAVQNTIGTKRSTARAATGFSGSLNGNDQLNRGFPFYWGQTPPYQSLNPTNGKSMVLYGYHLIHVPSSGMTFAELDARDAELYAKFFGEGGRYYGDTYSNPDSVLA